MAERALANPKIEVMWDSVVEEILGSDTVTGVRVRNVKSGDIRDFATEGVFVAIGHVPNTDLFKGQIELDDRGYVVLGNNTMTSVSGVFAAGDLADHTYRQAITAAGTGCMAAIDAERWLASRLE